MRYSKYSLFDFVEDESFQEWVMRPNKDSNFFWESFMANHHDKVNMIAEAKEIILSISFKKNLPGPELEETLLKNILQEKHSSLYDDNFQTQKEPGIIKMLINRFGGMAAVFLVVVISFVAWMYIFEGTGKGADPTTAVNYIERTLNEGERATYKLPDGTVVKMNSRSYIKFPEAFKGQSREIVLRGEAYFDVTHNQERPFLIHTGQLTTKVLGTSFNIKYTKETASLEVAVETGLVSVADNRIKEGENSILLKPEEKGIFNAGEMPVKLSFDYDSIFGWKDGLLILQESNLPEIFEKLEKWYGLEFIYPDNIKDVKYSGGKFNNMPLTDVLDGLSFSLKFNYTIKNDKVMISIKK